VAGAATSLKRFIPKARGSAGPIIKRRCHVRIVLTNE
jgi:large subunit ribosomal protein L22